MDENGIQHKKKFEGFMATIIQHEYDHLNGILFTDLIDQDQKKKLKKPLNLIKNRKLEVDYPVTVDSEYRL